MTLNFELSRYWQYFLNSKVEDKILSFLKLEYSSRFETQQEWELDGRKEGGGAEERWAWESRLTKTNSTYWSFCSNRVLRQWLKATTFQSNIPTKVENFKLKSQKKNQVSSFGDTRVWKSGKVQVKSFFLVRLGNNDFNGRNKIDSF